jgi:hypothetical protein
VDAALRSAVERRDVMHSEDARMALEYEAPELVLHGTIVEATEGGQQTNVSGGGGQQEKWDPLHLVWVLDLI